MRKLVASMICIILIVTCVIPISAAVCNHNTSGQTLYRDSAHPHNTYRRCVTCNLKVYTGNVYTVSDCEPCSDGVVSMRWPTESLTITSLTGGQYSADHTAIDILPLTSGVNGDDIYAMYDGEIMKYEFNYSAGNTCHINHSNPNRESSISSDAYIYTRYSHLMSSTDTTLPLEGDDVSAGELIGYMGNTGEVYGTIGPDEGSHLHFETRVKSSAFSSTYLWYSGTAVNPETYFYFRYPGNSARTAEIPVIEPLTTYTMAVDNKPNNNDARGKPEDTINYEIAPDMFINIEWVANLTLQECYENNIDRDIIHYFITRINSLSNKSEYSDLNSRLNYLYDSME